jgi:predicted phosphoribosyltransferase
VKSARNTFRNRDDAGRRLAELLRQTDWVRPVVLGLARGGIPVAAPVAAALGATLETVIARKIGAPGRPELGVGAVTAAGAPAYDVDLLRQLGLTPDDMAPVATREQHEAQRRLRVYRQGKPAVELRGRDALVIDDGLATGVTATAALREVRARRPRTTVFAAPTCSCNGVRALDAEADQIFCLTESLEFRSVGEWYHDFRQVGDDEVIAVLHPATVGDNGD